MTFTIGRNVRVVRSIAEDRTIAVEHNRFGDTFKKLQVRIYELK